MCNKVSLLRSCGLARLGLVATQALFLSCPELDDVCHANDIVKLPVFNYCVDLTTPLSCDMIRRSIDI